MELKDAALIKNEGRCKKVKKVDVRKMQRSKYWKIGNRLAAESLQLTIEVHCISINTYMYFLHKDEISWS
jgi:hypothetical protein